MLLLGCALTLPFLCWRGAFVLQTLHVLSSKDDTPAAQFQVTFIFLTPLDQVGHSKTLSSELLILYTRAPRKLFGNSDLHILYVENYNASLSVEPFHLAMCNCRQTEDWSCSEDANSVF